MNHYVALTEACQAAYEKIKSRHEDVPDAVVHVASGGRRAESLYGHFAPERWVYDDKIVHEILIVAEQLHRGAVDVFTTLLHEAVHGVAKTRGIKDVSGKRHNKKFRNLCEELELDPPEEAHKTLGFSAATLPESTKWIYEAEIKKIAEALNVCRIIIKDKEKVKTSWVGECNCPRKIRVGKPVASEATEDGLVGIHCKNCDTEFVLEMEEV